MNVSLRFLPLLAVVLLSGCVTVTSTDRKRIVETPNGRLLFELPSPAGHVSEHYRLPSNAGSFGYGEYHFDRGPDCNLVLQTMVRAKSDARNASEAELLQAAASERQWMGKPEPGARVVQTMSIRGHDVPIIEVQEVGGRWLRAELPFGKGSVVFYISEQFERPGAGLLTPFGEILRSVRLH